MKPSAALSFLCCVLLFACRNESKRTASFITDKRFMPRQVVQLSMADYVKDTCVEIWLEGTYGPYTEVRDRHGAFHRQPGMCMGIHTFYDSLGFELEKQNNGSFWLYQYSYDSVKRVLYKIGEDNRGGKVFLDTIMTLYNENGLALCVVSRENVNVFCFKAYRYDGHGRVVQENTYFLTGNFKPELKDEWTRKNWYYSGLKLDSIVTISPYSKFRFYRTKIAYDNNGFPVQLYVNEDSLYGNFEISACRGSVSTRSHN